MRDKRKRVTHGVTEMKHIKKLGRRAQTHIIAPVLSFGPEKVKITSGPPWL